MAESAVRYFAPEHPQLARTLRAKLIKVHTEFSAQIAGGYATDWSDYKSRIGFLKGLERAIDTCNDVEKDLHARETE